MNVSVVDHLVKAKAKAKVDAFAPDDAPAIHAANEGQDEFLRTSPAKYFPAPAPEVPLQKVAHAPTLSASRPVNDATTTVGASIEKSVVVNSPKELMRALKTCGSVTKVTLKGSGYTDAHIQSLPDSVRELIMPNSPAITPAAWKNLKGQIKLTLNGFNATRLQGLPTSVCELSLFNFGSMPAAEWKVFGTLTQLTKLTLEYMSVTDEVLKGLPASVRELSLLRLIHTQVTVRNWVKFEPLLPMLEFFKLDWAVRSQEKSVESKRLLGGLKYEVQHRIA